MKDGLFRHPTQTCEIQKRCVLEVDDDRRPAETEEEGSMAEEESLEQSCGNVKKSPGDMAAPADWLKMLIAETHWSFVFGVMVVYGISQGLGGAFSRVVTEYYMKDVQKVQPSDAQFYHGIVSLPWLVKPLWGILTDVLPLYGYHRRPYLVFAGLLGLVSMLVLSLNEKLQLVLALMALMAASAGAAIADVTIDACVVQNSNTHPSLAADMQSLCALSSSIGALVGFSISGIFVHLIGPMGAFGLLTIPSGLVFLVGILLDEQSLPNFNYGQVFKKTVDVGREMWRTMQFPQVWRPSLYMYLCLALSLNIHEGLFYWFTSGFNGGPAFSQESVGFILSIGSIGSLLGTILYRYFLKDHPFRHLLFWTQLFFSFSGMLDLILVLRLNLRIRIPDYFFAVIDAGVTYLIGRLNWMPLLVLASKLCPPGIEGTFFAFLMSIDNIGLLSSSWLGGLLLRLLKVTRTRFDNLWLAILIRNLFRLSPLCLLFLIPNNDSDASLLPTDTDSIPAINETLVDDDKIELISFVDNDEIRL